MSDQQIPLNPAYQHPVVAIAWIFGDPWPICADCRRHVYLGEDTWRHFVDWPNRVQSFADDMRGQGIHVGLGQPPRCVVDHEPWPCEHESGES